MFERIIAAVAAVRDAFSFSSAEAQEETTKNENSALSGYGTITAWQLPEIEGKEGPLLHVMTFKSTGTLRIYGDEMDDLYDDLGNLIADGDNTSIGIAENKAYRVIELNAFNDPQDVEREIQTWTREEGISRIGEAAPDLGAMHIITLVPATYSRDTELERVQLDRSSTPEDWALFREKISELLPSSPQPLVEK